ncbi:unnamed protein product [Ciceribacter sp. T2.26MG-112.2]|nr:unnamed protein product [Ciceribacter naphthalenivorans]
MAEGKLLNCLQAAACGPAWGETVEMTMAGVALWPEKEGSLK